MNKVIDVSYAQKNIDWGRVAKTDIKGVIIRCGFRAYVTGKLIEDDMFTSHLKGAKKAKLKIGVYFFSQAITEEEAIEEAKFTVKLIKGMNLNPFFPIAIDTERIDAKGARANNLSREKRTAIVKAFCEEIKRQGYTPMVYSDISWLNNQLNMSKLPYKVWVAQIYKECQYKNPSMWQYTWTGKVDGIQGDVDISYDYEFIKEKKMAMVKWSGRLTKHFSLSEYTVGNGNTTLTITEKAYQFAECLEEFRIWLGRPMIVTSWRRSKALNQKVGGISTSNHLTGTACDWYTDVPMTEERAKKYMKKWKKICKAHGFVGEAGWYPGWSPRGGLHLGLQNDAQIKANGGKFFNWRTTYKKDKNGNSVPVQVNGYFKI